MDFSLNEEQEELKKAVLEFARKELSDDVHERDKIKQFSHDLWQKCADFGIHGLPFPSKYGGLEKDIISTILALETLGYACKDNGLIFSINAQMWSVQMPIFKYGNELQKNKYLPELVNGKIIGAHAMSEPGSGSDAFSLTTTAVKRDNKYILNGTKTFSSNAPVADIFIVFATEGKKKGFLGISTFIVEKDFPGLHIGKNFGKMGLKTSPWSEIFFEDCVVPEENRLGRSGFGASIFNDSMEWERSFILSYCVGAMERQLEENIKYAKTRQQFGQPIGKFQSVANRIVDMKLRLETSRQLLYKVAWMKQMNSNASSEAAIAKLYISEAWVKSSMDTIKNFGGYGYSEEYEVERDLRDSIGTTIFSGTSDIQRVLIAKQLGL